jgi:hypothetical protein
LANQHEQYPNIQAPSAFEKMDIWGAIEVLNQSIIVNLSPRHTSRGKKISDWYAVSDEQVVRFFFGFLPSFIR